MRCRRALSVVVLGFICILLISCATPSSRPPVATSPEIEQEAQKQRLMVLKKQMDMQFKLDSIAQNVMVGATALCEKKRFWSGYYMLKKSLMKPELREPFAKVYGLGEQLKVIKVLDKSPAEKAGLRQGDEIVSINGREVPATAREYADFASMLRASGVLKMHVLRNGVPADVTVEQVTSCNYPVVMMNGNDVNAMADGQKIYVWQGLMRLMDNDAELATVIAHELAHNIRKHGEMAKSNMLAGGVGGLLLDIVAAAVGVNTQAGFSKMGQQIGRNAYSKDMEREADYVGLYLLALSGYDIREAPNVFRRLGMANPRSIEGKYAVSHPSTPERFVYIEKTVDEIEKKRSSGLALVPEEKN